MNKILITPRSYGNYDGSVVEMLRSAGYQPVVNRTGRILTKEEMMERIRDCVGVIVGVDPLDAEVLSCAPQLRAVSKYGVGVDNIDLQYCESRQIPVTITRGANTQAVADHAFSLLCCCARKIVQIHERCRAHDWKKVMGLDLYGRTLGILGLGAIGKGVARRASGFDMRVKAYDVFWDAAYAASHDIQRSSPEEIFSSCDFISLHLPLTEETKNIINEDAFAKMKPNCVLINTARGELVEESALIHALRSGRIAAAGIDVFREEPPRNQELYTLENLVMSSHCAASTQGASEQMSLVATRNLLASLQQTQGGTRQVRGKI